MGKLPVEEIPYLQTVHIYRHFGIKLRKTGLINILSYPKQIKKILGKLHKTWTIIPVQFSRNKS